MSCVYTKYHPDIGVLPDIGVAPPGERGASAGSAAGCMALVDTGASHSCISADVAVKAGIVPDGEMKINTPSQTATKAKTYTATFLIPGVGLAVPDVMLAEAVFPAASPYQALLGRDILCRGAFHLDFAGNAVFCI